MSSLGDLNQQADRLVHAVALYKAGKAPVILVTGGSAQGDRSEAQVMRDILEVMGVPRGVILMEERSRNTHDNAVYSTELLQQRELRRILLVTSAFHMRRALALFEGRGLEVIPAPAARCGGPGAHHLCPAGVCWLLGVPAAGMDLACILHQYTLRIRFRPVITVRHRNLAAVQIVTTAVCLYLACSRTL